MTTTLDEAAAKLDESLYRLDGKELAFFQRQTGIEDEEALKAHILDVQKNAYAVRASVSATFSKSLDRSIELWLPLYQRFLVPEQSRLKISKLPAYKRALKLIPRADALFLDIGCCFGNDVRKIIEDGWPVERTVASDIHPGLWDCGHKLFRSSCDTFPVTFIPGDAFDPDMISPRLPFYRGNLEIASPGRPSNLSNLKSLKPLQGHFSAIHASSLFHLFNEENQLILARRLATLLSPEPGSMIFGAHIGLPAKKTRWEHEAQRLQGRHMFCHSPETWEQVWLDDGSGQTGVFSPGTVKVSAGLKKLERESLANLEPTAEFWVMWWSVTRL